jgi:calcium/calmodulin-dependent protein kinase I
MTGKHAFRRPREVHWSLRPPLPLPLPLLLPCALQRSHDAMPAPYLASSPESSPSKKTPVRSFFGGPSRRQSFDCPQLHGYRVGKTLGKGKFGKVRTAVDKATGEVVAIKHIVKPEGKVELAAMTREVQLMQSVDHPRLVKLHKAVDTEYVLYLVVEQLHGGELFDRVVKRGPYPEEKARLVTRRLLDALLYLHAKGIAHRDLKPENILLASQSDDTQVKLIDFGLSRSFLAEAEDARTPTVMKSPKGTVGYAAPEILRQRTYSSAVDLWSLGVVVFILLCGYEPFHGETDVEVQRKTVGRHFAFHPSYWGHISADAKAFVGALLTLEPTERPTAAQALRHHWLTGIRSRSFCERLGGLCRGQCAKQEGPPAHAPLPPPTPVSYRSSGPAGNGQKA